VLAEEARQLLQNPVFQRAIMDEERRIVSNIANSPHDGSREYENQEREWCRELRTLNNLKRRIMSQPQNQELREANFASGSVD
jgi:hypothetical protein